jgi:hypothetical protein
MYTHIKKACLIVLLLAGSSQAIAQNNASSYFLDGYNYRFQMNPAFGNDRTVISIPGVSNLNVSIKGNLNLSDVLYNVNGKTTLFTHPDVSTQEVMSNFSDKNKLTTNIKENIITVGFKAFGGYNAVSINANVGADVVIPGSFISLAKEGATNTTYDISNLRASAVGYAEVALNHSRDIKQVPGLRVGATAKILVGAGKADAYFNKAQLVLTDNEWIATTNADIYANVANLQLKHKINENTGHQYVSGLDLDKFKLNGMGFALDLGAEYKFQDWSFSAALLDLGFINWKETYHASTNGDQTVNTSAYTFNVDGDAANSFDNEFDRFKDDLSALYELNDNGNIGSKTKGLATTLNVGVDYTLSAYKKLNFGLLNTSRLGDYAWTEFRLSANIRPVKALSASVNGVCGTYGAGFGWLLNVCPKGYNFFIGMDRMFTKLAKQGVPLNSNMHLNFGMSVAF